MNFEVKASKGLYLNKKTSLSMIDEPLTNEVSLLSFGDSAFHS